MRKIDQDHTRFRDIVRGKIKADLRKYVSSGEMIGKQGKRYVSIPLPQIQLPRFRFGSNEGGGVGSGEGEAGDSVYGEGEDPGQAGDQAGQHVLEVDVSLAELAKILGEELELPNIEPRGHKSIRAQSGRFTGISRTGPRSLRHFKRSFKEALKREVAAGTYDPARPLRPSTLAS